MPTVLPLAFFFYRVRSYQLLYLALTQRIVGQTCREISVYCNCLVSALTYQKNQAKFPHNRTFCNLWYCKLLLHPHAPLTALAELIVHVFSLIIIFSGYIGSGRCETLLLSLSARSHDFILAFE